MEQGAAVVTCGHLAIPATIAFVCGVFAGVLAG
jgi:hypothetical protein